MVMLREDDWTKPRRPETKGELSRENVHDILQGMQDLHEMARSCRLTADA